MPPTLLLIRHAEAEHNATENWDLPDPRLTAEGERQCRDLQNHLRTKCKSADDVELIVTSPLQRTLQTTLIGLDWLVKAGIPVEVDAMWQGTTKFLKPMLNHPHVLIDAENSDSPCDTGSSLDTIAAEFPGLDFSTVDPVFPSKAPNTPYAFTRTANRARGQACLEKLYSRPEKVVAVVSHSGFLRTGISKRRYANADYRVFTFRRRGDGGLSLVEERATAGLGGGMGRSEKGVQKVEVWDFPPSEDGEMEI